MISPGQLRAIQRMGERLMVETVVITHRLSMAKDSSNPFGDDDVGYATMTTTVKGWVAPILGKGFDVEAGQQVAIGDMRLRVPAGTVVDVGDTILIRGEVWAVQDSTIEQTWPEWVTVFCRHIQ